jgi:hypothetical protein
MGDMTDRNVEAVRNKLAERAATGLRKYGTTTERKDLTPLQWFQHLQDELMDAAVYAEVLMRTFAVEPSPPTPPDHGPKLIEDVLGYRLARRVNSVVEAFMHADGTWQPHCVGTAWKDKASALRALAKATGYEIHVVEHRGLYSPKSLGFTLNEKNQWVIGAQTAWYKATAEALARDCEARGHYPAEMCDMGEVE